MNRLAGALLVMLGSSVAMSATVVSQAIAQTPVTLRLGTGAPAQAHLNQQIYGPWAQKVTADSQGTLKIDFVPGGVLGVDGQLLERVRNGVVDIANDLPGYYPGRFTKTEVVALPLLFNNSEKGSQALWKLFESGKVSDEYQGIKVLGIAAVPNALFMGNAPIEKMDDFKGKKMQASTKLRNALVQALGGIPVSVPVPDTYQSLSKTTINVAVQPWTAVQPFKLSEVATNYLELPIGGSVMMFFMNKDKYDALPPQAKKAIDDNSYMLFSKKFGAFWDKVANEGKETVVKAGRTVKTVPEAEYASWRKVLDPVKEGWLKDIAGGADILKAFTEEYANAGK